MLCTEIVSDIQNLFCTQNVFPCSAKRRASDKNLPVPIVLHKSYLFWSGSNHFGQVQTIKMIQVVLKVFNSVNFTESGLCCASLGTRLAKYWLITDAIMVCCRSQLVQSRFEVLAVLAFF
jgi:hypothetical protein